MHDNDQYFFDIVTEKIKLMKESIIELNREIEFKKSNLQVLEGLIKDFMKTA